MLTPGIALELTFPVTETLTAKTVGSGTLDVLATPGICSGQPEKLSGRTVDCPHGTGRLDRSGSFPLSRGRNRRYLDECKASERHTHWCRGHLPRGTDRSRRQTIGFPRNRTRFPRSRGGRYPRTCDRSK